MRAELAILGLGSNLGEREKHLDRACDALKTLLQEVQFSSRMETPALLPVGAPAEWNRAYLNMAASGATTLSPQQLLEAVKNIELSLGRQVRGVWGPREIDIDILAYGDQVVHTPSLSIPHKELLNRVFALKPLTEIAPDWIYPAGKYRGKTAKELLKIVSVPRTQLVGILNLTPDSFSDGGLYNSVETAIAHGESLHAQGAQIIDVGAESTRPGASALSTEEEWQRLSSILPALLKLPVQVSVDTRHASTARKALAAGAAWINDVSGFRDAEMIAAVKDTGCRLVAMHALTVPADARALLLPKADVMQEIITWGKHTLQRLQDAGIGKERIILDPGIGFGKTAAQSAHIIANADMLKEWEVPVMIGHSRKSFLGSGASLPARDAATLIVSEKLMEEGVDYLRVHDVAAHAALLKA